MLFYGTIFLLVACLVDEAQSATTVWPEICRVMALYRTCDDFTFRVACPYRCRSLEGECGAKGMTYFKSKGYCYGLTSSGENLWPFAMSSCLAYGGKLAVLKDASDADVFQTLFNSYGGSQDRYLVGALNVGKEGTWVHVDGTEVDSSYWASGSKPSSSSNTQCMGAQRDNQFKQFSDNCGTNRGFICYAL